MSVSSGSLPLLPSPAATSGAMTADTTMREESSSRRPIFRVKESTLKKWQLERDMRKEAKAKQQRYRNEMREEMMDTAFIPEPFGTMLAPEQAQDKLWRSSVVSIALFNGDVLVYACSGTAVRHWHANIKDVHTIFVTSARLAQKFNDNRTRDDNLRIEVRTCKNETLHGSLGLYDEKNGIAIVTSLSLKCVYTMDTCNPPTRGKLSNILHTVGCATDGTLMGATCSHPVFEDKSLVSVNCKITEIGLGGPVMHFLPDGSAHIVGLIIDFCEDKITLLPTKKLNNWLLHLLQITSKTSHFRGYSLPKGVQAVIPSGFMVESKILQSLGYPLPPPLLFEFNGRMAGGFEKHFGQLQYWEGYPFNFAYDYGTDSIWDKLGKTLTKEISQSVVSVASFKDNKRYFACTGLLIKSKCGLLVLTSASLVRTRDAEGDIDKKLKIEVFLPQNHTVEGVLALYHQNYNIAVVQLMRHFPIDIFFQDINVRVTRSSKSVAAIGHAVVAIGRATKESHGLLMASMGEVKGKYKAVKNKWSTGLAKKLGCQDLHLSTCQIKKVGIGGPLIDLAGRFIGMNFYDESGTTTPFLPRKEILTVLHEGFDVLEKSSMVNYPVNMEDIRGHLSSKTLKRKRNEWPVSEPYWYLPGQVDPLDQHVGKVLM